jgi:phospholipid transport system transporter-binding protein
MSERIQVSGELTLATVASRCKELDACLTAGADIELDLSGVTHADSSSLTLLLCWLRQANQCQARIRIAALPQSIQQLIDVYDLRELLLPAIPA